MTPLRLAFVGGGLGAGIAQMHLSASRLDGCWSLVAGAFSRNAERNSQTGTAYGVSPQRCYGSVEALIAGEAARSDGADCVAILAPNDVHAPASIACLDAGLSVLCEKPMAVDLAEALAVRAAAERSSALYRIVHNYSAFPMAIEAGTRVGAGHVGTVRQVVAEFANGSRATMSPAELAGTSWWMDPGRSGPSIVLGNLGSHMLHLIGRMTSDRVATVSARLSTVVPGRTVHDTATLSITLASGSSVELWLSMAAPGNGHGLRVRVFGDRGLVDWRTDRADVLALSSVDAPATLLRRGEAWLSDAAKHATRTKPGQTEGFIEAMGNIYRDLAEQLVARREGRLPHTHASSPATLDEGVAVMSVIDAAMRSHAAGGAVVPVSRPAYDEPQFSCAVVPP